MFKIYQAGGYYFSTGRVLLEKCKKEIKIKNDEVYGFDVRDGYKAILNKLKEKKLISKEIKIEGKHSDVCLEAREGFVFLYLHELTIEDKQGNALHKGFYANSTLAELALYKKKEEYFYRHEEIMPEEYISKGGIWCCDRKEFTFLQKLFFEKDYRRPFFAFLIGLAFSINVSIYHDSGYPTWGSAAAIMFFMLLAFLESGILSNSYKDI